MKLIIVTTCKPFIGQAELIQTQAIESWTKLKNIEVNILILGDEKGVKEICEKYNLIQVIEFKKFHIFPYISSMLNSAYELANDNDIIMWTNSDIIYTQTLINTILEFKKLKIEKYALVGQRLDWKNFKKVELNNDNLKNIISESNFHYPCGIDYIIHGKTSFNKELYANFSMPAIIADQKILGRILNSNIYSCDCTATILAIHHDCGIENRESKLFKLVSENNKKFKSKWGNIKQCKNNSYFDYNTIKFKSQKDINWIKNRKKDKFKLKMLNLENKFKNKFISLLNED